MNTEIRGTPTEPVSKRRVKDGVSVRPDVQLVDRHISLVTISDKLQEVAICTISDWPITLASQLIVDGRMRCRVAAVLEYPPCGKRILGSSVSSYSSSRLKGFSTA